VATRLRSLVRLATAPVRRKGDAAFLERAYPELLGRPPDPEGRATYLEALARGTLTRGDVALDLAASAEHLEHVTRNRGVRVHGSRSLPDLTEERPDHYELGVDLQGRELLAFNIGDPTDFDWLERRIQETGFYDHDGVWTLDIDLDKRLMAELIASLEPASVLELGCSSGAVLAGLVDRGIDVTGVDVSEHARARALPTVRDRIVLGDLLTLDLPGGHDVVVGLDVFEHLNPNRLPAYLGKLASLVREGGWCVANIPAFGDDPVFGTVFDDYLEEPGSARLFTRLHVDDRGYPLHGHLIWATWQWWVDRFEEAGFRRRRKVEQAIQERYGDHWRAVSPARQTMFVFRKGDVTDGEDALVTSITAHGSAVLSSSS
jgi:SAM-dependent methyltransferase